MLLFTSIVGVTQKGNLTEPA